MLFTLILFASTVCASCLHGLSMFKRDDALEGGVKLPGFGYGPLNGPFNWATLAPENAACKSGTGQSPINIDNTISAAPAKPVLNIPKQEVHFENLGTNIQVLLNGTTSLAGNAFQLVQFHMHTPSEHHMNGEYHPIEVHMVHQGIVDPTQIAVIALFLQVSMGSSNSLIASLSPHVKSIATPGDKVAIPAGVDFTDVISKIASSPVLQYTGSLTTPPCTEGVTFIIVKDPLDISVADFNAIKAVVKFNARFIQNVLGHVNILEVGALAGSPGAIQPPKAQSAVANATVEPNKAVMTPGQRFTVTELLGQPTDIAAVVVAPRKKKY